MKRKLVEFFGNRHTFISIRPNTPEVVISSEAIEFTLNMSDKSAFSRNSCSILKWYLNISEQATNTKALDDLAGLGKNNTSYEPLRPSQILKSESLVAKVQAVLENEYLNTFKTALDQSKLYNLSSGSPLKDESAEAILKLPEVCF